MNTETYEYRGQIFKWDREKSLSNIEKHGVSFKSGAVVFFDPNAVEYDDEDNSFEEERFKIIGLDESQRLLMVSHCYRENDSIIRIISTRKASKSEGKKYGGAQ
jgi:uncharacterized DUF497 family protein